MSQELCLVTGGAGFIGSHLVERLLKEGFKVKVLDNFATGKMDNLKSFLNDIELIEGDIRSLKACQKACSGVHYVFHKAALGSVPRSIEDPLTSNEVNITGTLNMLMAAREAQVSRFVFASSSSVYGDTEALSKVETLPPNPLSPYAVTKYAAEKYVNLFHKLYGFETISIRYFNVFGPRQDPDSQYAAVIPRFFTKLICGEAPIIFGDGNQTRDFTFINDVVEANILSLKADLDACGRTYNIACNRQTSLRQLFEAVRGIVSVAVPKVATIEPLYEQARVGDVRNSLADISLAKKHLNYVSGYTVHQGLEKTVDYYLR